jgi:hypothetical protein
MRENRSYGLMREDWETRPPLYKFLKKGNHLDFLLIFRDTTIPTLVGTL